MATIIIIFFFHSNTASPLGPLDREGLLEFLFESIKGFYFDLSQVITESSIVPDYKRKGSITDGKRDGDRGDFNNNNDLNVEKILDYAEKIDLRADERSESWNIKNDKNRSDREYDHSNHNNSDDEEDDDHSDDIVSWDNIRHLSSRVACLCAGFTGAEMKLLMKRATMTCLGESAEEIDQIDKKRKEKGGIKEVKEKVKEEESDPTHRFRVDTEWSIEELQQQQRTKFSFILRFRHFECALHHVYPSVTSSELLEYEDWASARH